jgi:hypothetical protein
MSAPPQDDSKWSKASISIYSETLTPEEIGTRLQLTASKSHTKGSLKSARVPIPWKNSFWALDSPLEDQRNMSDHLKWLLDVIDPKADALKDLSEHCKVLFFCAFASENGQGGFTLDAATLTRLAKLGIPFSLNLYPPQSGNASEMTSMEVES